MRWVEWLWRDGASLVEKGERSETLQNKELTVGEGVGRAFDGFENGQICV